MIVIPYGDPNAHGALGKALIFERRRGKVYAKVWRKPFDPRSPLALERRAKFKFAVQAWNYLTQESKDYYSALAEGKSYTGYNLYIKKYILDLLPSTTPLLLQTVEDLVITTPRAIDSDGWINRFATVAPVIQLAYVLDNSNQFEFLNSAPVPQSIYYFSEEGSELPNIQAGDSILITYDGGKHLMIWFPAVQIDGKYLYIADDGSTYHDAAMTELAFSAP